MKLKIKTFLLNLIYIICIIRKYINVFFSSSKYFNFLYFHLVQISIIQNSSLYFIFILKLKNIFKHNVDMNLKKK